MPMWSSKERAWRETEGGPRCGKRGEEFAFCFITTGKQCILKGECDSIV